MATRTRRTESTEENSQESGQATALPTLDHLSAAPERELERSYNIRPNPLDGAVKASVDAGQPMALPAANEDQARQITNLLRREAKQNEWGLSVKTHDNGDGTYRVVFQGRTQKRRYATA